MTGRLGLTDIAPTVSCGDYPARAVVGEAVPIAATVFREGHGLVGANVVWRGPGKAGTGPLLRMTPGAPGLDQWHATVTPTEQGMWSFLIEAWADPFATWRHNIEVKVAAGQGIDDLSNDLELGARLLSKAGRTVPKEHRAAVRLAEKALRDSSRDLRGRLGPAV